MENSESVWLELKNSKKILKIGSILVLIGILINVVFLVSSFRRGYFHKSLVETHAGKIIEINENNIKVEENDGKILNIQMSLDTDIRRGERKVNEKEIKAGDYAFVVGPFISESEINARMIRLFDDMNQIRMFDFPKF